MEVKSTPTQTETTLMVCNILKCILCKKKKKKGQRYLQKRFCKVFSSNFLSYIWKNIHIQTKFLEYVKKNCISSYCKINNPCSSSLATSVLQISLTVIFKTKKWRTRKIAQGEVSMILYVHKIIVSRLPIER